MMTRKWQEIVAAAGIGASLVMAAPARAGTFNSGSTGADGAFNPTCAPTPCTVTVALPASGIFNFTTITVAAGITVQFTKNVTNTPVTMLATGDATIAGTVRLDASPGTTGVTGTSFASAGGPGGPGGFAGGAGGNGVLTVSGGAGLGPGGGATPTAANFTGAGGGFGTAGGNSPTFSSATGGPAYGNPQLLPLIGGSGGGGGSAALGFTAGAAGGGGGAILIAASGTITLTGTISAKGGDGGGSGTALQNGGASGSGGGVRLAATTLAGTGGTVNVTGGGPASGAGAGGVGRTRLEAFTNTLTVNVSGVAPSTGTPGAVFPASLPSLSIASVAAITAPAAPTGSYATPDITLPSATVSPVAVVVTGTTIPDGTAVVLRGKPQTGSTTTATTPGLSGGTASANLALDLAQTNVISAEATFQIAAIDVPIKVAEAAGPDDPVTHVRVSAAFGGASQVAYITRAGREIVP